MTYTRSHTRPSKKDLGCVVYPLNNKSLSKSHVRSVNKADPRLFSAIITDSIPYLLLANVGRASILTHNEERLAIIAVLADGRWGDGTKC